ncbi:hypothetical protein SD77_0939 [Bacillus badius]|uniref:Mobile element protein n=1 Tax=Bacillus badius TaxID=1455 RepID=A0ABR5AT77_BACBA|nr:hypothetical protein SD78_2547 [Bacillus badius]KIL77960.1 hypothetical protein SD77_0939 [Bacillus badius]
MRFENKGEFWPPLNKRRCEVEVQLLFLETLYLLGERYAKHAMRPVLHGAPFSETA